MFQIITEVSFDWRTITIFKIAAFDKECLCDVSRTPPQTLWVRFLTERLFLVFACNSVDNVN